jgi:hypothetical protein
MEAPDGTVSWEVEPYILLSHPYPNSQGTFFTDIHFRVTYKELAVPTNVGVQTDNIHITDFYPLLDSVVRFRGIGSTTVQGVSNIYWRMLYIGVRAKFIFEDRIVTQDIFKIANHIETTV